MSDFIREVDDEVRHDRIRLFLERYWYVVAGLAVLVLAGVGAWKANEYFRTAKAQGIGGRYLEALALSRDGKPAEAKTLLDGVASDGTPGYRLMARMRIAADTGKQDPAAGAALFDAVAADETVDPVLRNLARLRAALLLVDTASFPDIKRRLEPLADANNSLRNTARELLAVAALKAGQDADAKSPLDAIEADPTATPALRQRAGAYLALIRADGGDRPSTPSAAPAAVPAEAPK